MAASADCIQQTAGHHDNKQVSKAVINHIERPQAVDRGIQRPQAVVSQAERLIRHGTIVNHTLRPLNKEEDEETSQRQSVRKSNSGKMSSERPQSSEGVRQLKMGSPLTLCLPAVGSGGRSLLNLSYQAIPLKSVQTTSLQGGTRKRAHGGGWPKGKSRKVERGVAPPKLAATG